MGGQGEKIQRSGHPAQWSQPPLSMGSFATDDAEQNCFTQSGESHAARSPAAVQPAVVGDSNDAAAAAAADAAAAAAAADAAAAATADAADADAADAADAAAALYR